MSQENAAMVARKLGNVGVLTVQTAEVATGSGDGIGKAAGKKMKERFFFYGIDVPCDDLIVHQGVENAVPVFPHRAYASFPAGNKALMAAEAAEDLAAPFSFLEHGLFQ